MGSSRAIKAGGDVVPRAARRKSASGIYHIILRVINRQKIFEDDEDNQKFIRVLQRYKEVSAYELYAYCLMGNHLHLLLRVGKEPLEQVMRRICASYVYWYNKKYDRIGNLFQDRFKSEPVDDDSYFLTVLRYIHQNPYKAGLVKDHGDYKWSSYGAYIHKSQNNAQLVNVEFALQMFNENSSKSVKNFIDFHRELKDDACLDVQETPPISDQKAKETIKQLCNINNFSELHKMNKEKRDSCLKQLKDEYKLSIRQLERVTGINRGIIFKA